MENGNTRRRNRRDFIINNKVNNLYLNETGNTSKDEINEEDENEDDDSDDDEEVEGNTKKDEKLTETEDEVPNTSNQNSSPGYGVRTRSGRISRKPDFLIYN